MKYCPNCGNEVGEGDTYCHECGEELTDVGAETTETEGDEEAPEDEVNTEEEVGEPQDEDTEELTDLKAVGESKAEALRGAGYETVDDLRDAEQEEIAEVENIGAALSARIKSNADRTELEEDTSGTSISLRSAVSVLALIALVALAGVFMMNIVTNLEPGASPDSPDAQEPETTDGSGESSGTDSTDTGTEDTTQSSSTGSGGQDSDSNNQDSGLQYGETHIRPNGVEITVSSPEKIDSFSANGVTQTPEDGNTFVQVFVTARNPTQEEKSLPYQREFSLIFQNRQYETASFSNLKQDAYEGTNAQPGIVRDGSIVFETTEEADLSEIEIVWSSLDESATWG